MKHVDLTTEWLSNWRPRKREEVGDRRCRGLVVRAGPSGAKTFYRWADERDAATSKTRRKRIALGRWSVDGGRGTLSLGEARDALLKAHAVKRGEVDGTGERTVADLATSYRVNVLANRDPKGAAWSWALIANHVLGARPEPKRPPFGEWPARHVKAADIAKVVELAKPRRKETRPIMGSDTQVSRRVGGPAVARAVLAEVKAIFANAVGSGALDSTPAAVLRGKSLGLSKPARHRFLNADELLAFFEALDVNALLDGTAKPQKLSETVRLALAFLLYVPVRSHSLIAAEWTEVDLDAKRWTVPVARLKLTKEARRTARPFVAPLPWTAVAVLKRLKALAGESRWVLASPVEPSGNEVRHHLSEKVLVRAVARLQGSGRLAFGAKFTVHDLRRTWRAWAGDLGVPFEIAEKSLAHVLPGVADVYARGDYVEKRAEAAELVAAAFDRLRLGQAAEVVPIATRVRP